MGEETPAQKEVHMAEEIQIKKEDHMAGETQTQKEVLTEEVMWVKTGAPEAEVTHALHTGTTGRAMESGLAVHAEVKKMTKTTMMDLVQFAMMAAGDCQAIQPSCRFLTL